MSNSTGQAAGERTARREEEILAVCLDLFYDRGFQAVGLRDLTAALQVNVATLYHYFASKDQILFRLQCGGMELLLSRANEALANTEGESPSVRIRALLDAHLKYHTENYKIAKLHFSDFRSMTPESQQAVRALMKQYERLFVETIEAGMETGEFAARDATMAAYTLLGAGAYVSNWYKPTGRLPAEEVVATNVEILLQGLYTR